MIPAAEVRRDAAARLCDLAYPGGHRLDVAAVAARRESLNMVWRRAMRHADGDPDALAIVAELWAIATTTTGLLDAVLHGIPDQDLPAAPTTIADLEEALRGI